MSEIPSTPPPAPLSPVTPEPSSLSSEERNWGMIAHFSGLTGLITGGLGNVIGPLVVWLIKKDNSTFAAEQAKEALNFQITCLLAALVCVPLCLVLIGIPLIIIVVIASWVLGVIAGIQAGEGKAYRYPFTLRLVK